jgi:hypothetical protein
MKIVPIFAPYLHSFKFNDRLDELSRLFEFWTNQEELRNYFQTHSNVLAYYHVEIDDAIEQTIHNADSLYDLLSQNKNSLDSVFEKLSMKDSQTIRLLPSKSKRKWLRLYALKIESNYYVITGGAIKQSQEMKDHPHTQEE